MSTDLIYEIADAQFVAKWRIEAYSLPRREVMYDADPVFSWLAEGTIVTITDPDLSLYNAPAIWSSSWSDGRLSGRLLLLSNPNLDVGDTSG